MGLTAVWVSETFSMARYGQVVALPGGYASEPHAPAVAALWTAEREDDQDHAVEVGTETYRDSTAVIQCAKIALWQVTSLVRLLTSGDASARLASKQT
jgi:hypothetical protein